MRNAMLALLVLATPLVAALPASSTTGAPQVMLPSGWVLSPPQGAHVETGTMPQGMAPAADGSSIAVVESGYRPPTLSLYDPQTLAKIAAIDLPGAMGRPVWIDANHVAVAGANADALLIVDTTAKSVKKIALAKDCYPSSVALAPDGVTFAVASDNDGAVRVGTADTIASASATKIGGLPGGVAFSADGNTVFAPVRSGSQLIAIDAKSHAVRRASTALHPSAIARDGDTLYVAESDNDSVARFDARDLHLIDRIALGDASGRIGVSPNAITLAPQTVYVSLGAGNSIAVVRNGRVAGRIPAGWYPTDAFAAGGRMYILDGKGEGARPNPRYRRGSDLDYIGTLEYGSLRAYDLPADNATASAPQGAQVPANFQSSTVVRSNGPIKHVILILKENRTYDQVLGDVAGGNGDPSLAFFGGKVTPNHHALALRFGLFDNAYTNGEVSAAGHNWVDAGFANDDVERQWPAAYGNRGNNDDVSGKDPARVPAAGFLWEAAKRSHVTFRDYGELTEPGTWANGAWVASVPSLKGVIDPNYAGWNLNYSDLDRVKEWRKDFQRMLAAGTLPQLELVFIPNDHTYGGKAGELAPKSYVAINDYAVGQLIDTLSHSKVWRSTAVFITEDDSQDGADHVSDQRTTVYVVSPYARGGVIHQHYATTSILRTIETMLGIQPLSNYDATAVPMNAAFRSTPNLRPYIAIPPQIDVTERNHKKAAYLPGMHQTIDGSRPDAFDSNR